MFTVILFMGGYTMAKRSPDTGTGITMSLIKAIREKNKLTPEELCEGICSKSQLLKIESGIYRPPLAVLESIMQRLGEDPHQYYIGYATIENKRVADLKKEMNSFLRERKSHEAQELLNILEEDEGFKAKINIQFLLYTKAVLAFYEKDYDNAHQHALKGIKLTKKKFQENEVDNYVLTIDEIRLVLQFSLIYLETGAYDKCAELLFKLKKSVDNNYFDNLERTEIQINILYNLTKCLGLLGRTDEWLCLCIQGIEFCVEICNAYYLPMFMTNKAYYFFHLGKTDEGKKLINDAFVYFACHKRTKEIEILKEGIKKRYGIEINFDI